MQLAKHRGNGPLSFVEGCEVGLGVVLYVGIDREDDIIRGVAQCIHVLREYSKVSLPGANEKEWNDEMHIGCRRPKDALTHGRKLFERTFVTCGDEGEPFLEVLKGKLATVFRMQYCLGCFEIDERGGNVDAQVLDFTKDDFSLDEFPVLKEGLEMGEDVSGVDAVVGLRPRGWYERRIVGKVFVFEKRRRRRRSEHGGE